MRLDRLLRRGIVATAFISVLAGCGGGGGGDPAPTITPTYTIGGSVSGLAGSGLVLQDNGGDDRSVAASGAFAFATALKSGDAYAVTVKTQPASPAQTCTVAGGSGVVAAANIAAVAVTCVTTVVDNRALQVSLSPLPNAAIGVVAPYVLTEAQGIALTSVSWTFDGQPGSGSSAVGVALHVWNTPGLHTVSATASASNGRTATATLSLFAVSQPLAGGSVHNCALTVARAVKCWGDNNSGELGNSSTIGASTPVDVQGLSGVLGLAAGDMHSCALKGDGTVACWGQNIEGELGNAATFHSGVVTTPQAVDGLTGVVALAAGRYHTCALKADGTVACFGQNSENELGTAVSASASATATVVAGLSNVVAISAGHGYFSCALKADATVACWGDNESGQLGNNDHGVAQTGTPQTVKTEAGATLGNVLVIRSGQSHSCAIVADGANSVWCWGNNGNAQVSSVTGSHYGAIKVAGLSNVLMLALTDSSSCALDTSYAYRCWGSNSYGEADGSTASSQVGAPALFNGLTVGTPIGYAGGGNETMCVLQNDGSAACVGRGGNGQLGNGAAQDAISLRAVGGGAIFWRWLAAAQ